MLDGTQLKKIRRGIYEDFDTFSDILKIKSFKQEIGDLYRDEDTLQRVPNGFDKNHPAAEYLNSNASMYANLYLRTIIE
jgi:Conserved hypothetical protein (DUF2461).